jgi:predicted RNA-binding protein
MIFGGPAAGHAFLSSAALSMRQELTMSSRTYWLDLFTWVTWQEFLAADGAVSGFREGRWNTVQQIKPGDYLLCYLTGVSRWIGILEVVSEPYMDQTPLWKDATFPCRVGVKIVT